ncbi:glutathionyl-hydroquinone reductase YqjG-like [Paramacrobiotus metropolitanus]|uniref:glutathionyl-hydroquinone reductase YqjG-like n=1 Tax=Paramacrobiotus metropolitanus TaxID=2943436 RepID=UPI002445DC9C|nr:glutathionyl-hydroquinone reductase YqjG-like [Paramacrobiotus metropolitanus]
MADPSSLISGGDNVHLTTHPDHMEVVQNAPSWKASMTPSGEYVRAQSAFRHFVTAEGSSGFVAEPGRYHLYVSLACPWAHRTLIVRKLKGLEDIISVNVVDWLLQEVWSFNGQRDGCTPDTVNSCATLRDVYHLAQPGYSGRVTVPVLWDKKEKTIVNNESSEIIRMLNVEFNAFCQTDEQRNLDLYPVELRAEIDAINEWIYRDINNGVYKCGFARSQEAYDNAVINLFAALDKVEVILSEHRYLLGSQLTEADIRLFTTLVRFDMVYVTHFKCNRKRIADYKNLWGFVRDIYQTAGIGETVNMEHIVNHYYQSHRTINPFGIVPLGPVLDFNAVHERGKEQNV